MKKSLPREPLPPKVLGVLAGRDLAPGALEAWLAWADRVVAADGGADLCRAAGREPDSIVGDLDSISDASGLVADRDQDSSDADKLLAYLSGEEAVTLIGVEGDRLDHVLATLYSCARSEIQDLQIVLRTGMCFVRRGFRSEWWACTGRVSLIPLGRCRVTLEGVRWPLRNRVLEPLGLVSLSNEVVGEMRRDWGPGVDLTVFKGVAALFVSADPLPDPSSWFGWKSGGV